MSVVVSFVVTLQTFFVSNQFHIGLLIQVPMYCNPVGVIARMAVSHWLTMVDVAGSKTRCLLLASIAESVVVRVV